MQMTSLEFKTLCVNFSRQLETTSEELFEAIDDERPLDQMRKEMDAARATIGEYEASLNKLDELKRSQFMTKFQGTIDEIIEIMSGFKE